MSKGRRRTTLGPNSNKSFNKYNAKISDEPSFVRFVLETTHSHASIHSSQTSTMAKDELVRQEMCIRKIQPCLGCCVIAYVSSRDARLCVYTHKSAAAECKQPLSPARMLSIAPCMRAIDIFSHERQKRTHTLTNHNATAHLRQSGRVSCRHA